MSLSQKVLALISGLDNPKARMDVAATINFLFGVYADARINDEQLRNDLYDICRDVIAMGSPELAEDEIRNRATAVADDLVKAMRIEALARRTISRMASAYKF